MCEVFSEVLGVDKVGIKDNFFELGGHSLKAIWLVKQLEVKTGHRISLDDVLKSPNVEMLASLLTDTSAEGAEKIKTAYQTLSQLVVRRNDPVILCFPFAVGAETSALGQMDKNPGKFFFRHGNAACQGHSEGVAAAKRH